MATVVTMMTEDDNGNDDGNDNNINYKNIIRTASIMT